MMPTAQRDSLIAAALLVVLCVTQRRQLFAVSTLSFFFGANLVFGFVGTLLLPWALSGVMLSDELHVGFGFLDWRAITDADMSRTILLYVGGFFLVFVGHRTVSVLSAAAGPPRSPLPRELALPRVLWLLPVFLVYNVAHVALNSGVFLTGLQQHILADYKADLLTYRTAATSDYLFVLSTYNVLPFLSTVLWIRARTRPTPPLFVFNIVCVVITATMLLLTFQTLPLMIFAIAIASFELSAGRYTTPSDDTKLNRRPLTRAVLLLAGLFLAVSVLLTTMRSNQGEASPAVAPALEIFGRISASAPFFVRYFTVVEPHYGLSGVGMISMLLDQPVYETTGVVYRFFTGERQGSSAVCALIDFYGAFGWVGWFACSLGLGGALAVLDRVIARLPKDESRLVALIFSFTFCLHLGDASIFNAAFGYGGLFFLVLWLTVFPRRPLPRALARSERKSPLVLGPSGTSARRAQEHP